MLSSELLWVLSSESCGCCFNHSLLFYLDKRINNVFYSDSLSGIIVLTAAAVLQYQDAEVSGSLFRDVGPAFLPHSALDLLPQVAVTIPLLSLPPFPLSSLSVPPFFLPCR